MKICQPQFMSQAIGNHISVSVNGVFNCPVAPESRYLLLQSLEKDTRMTLEGSEPSATHGFLIRNVSDPVIIPVNNKTQFRFYSTGSVLEIQWGKH
jgi:hypothetical protein